MVEAFHLGAPASIPAIPTVYNGVQYRSRLEARWACMFTLLGWEFGYEPFEQNGWLPDFTLGIEGGDFLVEVKPSVYVNEELLQKMEAATPSCVLLLLTEKPSIQNFGRFARFEDGSWHWTESALTRILVNEVGNTAPFWMVTQFPWNGDSRFVEDFEALWNKAGNEIHKIRTWGKDDRKKAAELRKSAVEARIAARIAAFEQSIATITAANLSSRLSHNKESNEISVPAAPREQRHDVTLYGVSVFPEKPPEVVAVGYESNGTSLKNSTQPVGFKQFKIKELPIARLYKPDSPEIWGYALASSKEAALSLLVKLLREAHEAQAEVFNAHTSMVYAAEEIHNTFSKQKALENKRAQLTEGLAPADLDKVSEFVESLRKTGVV